MTAFRIIRELLALGLMLFSCTHAPTGQANGGGSEVEVRGVALTPQGAPVAGARVTLRRADYLAPIPGGLAKGCILAADTITDMHGRYVIHSIDTGHYSMEINDTKTSALLVPCRVDGTQKNVDLGTAALSPYAVMSGQVTGTPTSPSARYVQVRGLDRLVALDASGSFLIPDLPAGSYMIRITSADTTVRTLTVDSVTAISGDTVNVPYAGWIQSKKVLLNTTPTGAGISTDISGFPILIRLNTATFDFATAQDSGQDLRFTTVNGTPLPFQIEQWDHTAMTAAVWVRMDTVHGNDSTQSIMMYWGALSPVHSSSDGATAFDTSDGFAGVWQMSGSGAVSGVQDQTGRRNDGVAVGSWQPSGRVPGIIGGALWFNGTDNMIVCATNTAHIGTGSATLSAWVRTSDTMSQPVMSYQNNQNRLRIAMDERTWIGLLPGTNTWLESPYYAPTPPPFVADGTWHLMTGVFDRSGNALMYVDGVIGDTLDISSAVGIDMSADSLVIGYDNFRPPGYYTGMIDEVRFEIGVRSAAWVKLCYENQRPDQTLVRFR